jgi:hypothetical protein
MSAASSSSSSSDDALRAPASSAAAPAHASADGVAFSSLPAAASAATAFLDSLGPEAQLRYKAFVTASISPEVVASLAGNMLPPMMPDEDREAVYVALAAAAKCFAVQVAELAVDLARGEGGVGGAGAAAGAAGARGPRARVQPGHIAEAYRRLVLQGKVPGVGPHHGHGSNNHGGSGGGGGGGGVAAAGGKRGRGTGAAFDGGETSAGAGGADSKRGRGADETDERRAGSSRGGV